MIAKMNRARSRPICGRRVMMLGVCVPLWKSTRSDSSRVAFVWNKPPTDGPKALRSAATHDRTPHNQPTLAKTIADACQNVSQESTESYRLYYTMA